MILCRVDFFGYCNLDIDLKRIEKYPKGVRPGGDYKCKGVYYEDGNIFLAMYETLSGPMIYFAGKEYPLMPQLTISVEKMGDNRHFSIKEYGIEIDYPTSKFIDMDVWSTEEDVDLFVNIANNYQSKAFYEKYTSKE